VRRIEQLFDRLVDRRRDLVAGEVADHVEGGARDGLGAAEDADERERAEQGGEHREHRLVGQGRRDVPALADPELVHGATEEGPPVVARQLDG
jgi:hypothetical protein